MDGGILREGGWERKCKGPPPWRIAFKDEFKLRKTGCIKSSFLLNKSKLTVLFCGK